MITAITYLLAGVCVLLAVAFELWKFYLERTIFKEFSYLRGLPVLGAIPYAISLDNETIIDFVAMLFESFKQQPFYLWLISQIVVVTGDPDDIQTILNSNHFLSKSYVYESFQMSHGLLCAPPERWKRHRRALNPTLSGKMVSGFVPTFNEVAQAMARHYLQHVGELIDPNRMMMVASYTALIRTAFGVPATYGDPVADNVHQMLAKYMHYVERRAQRPWYRQDFIYRWSADYREFKAARDTLNAHMERHRQAAADLLSTGDLDLDQNKLRLNWAQKCMLLKENGEFSDRDIADELLILLVGGTDTSAATMNAVLLMLAIHPEYQQLCVDELHDIVDGVDDPLDEEQLSKMTYMEMVMKEALRLYPIATFLVRENSEPVLFRGAMMPAKTQFALGVYQVHRDPSIWGESALRFWPERFLPENYANVHPYAFLPFSGGPRNCIGLRYAWPMLKISLAYLLRYYKFTTELKISEIRFELNAVSRILNADAVRLERRQW